MPISFADLVAEVATVTVDTSLGPVEVKYRPNVMTPAKEAELQRLGQDDDEGGDYALAALFCEVVDHVDIAGPMFDDDGREIVPAGALIPMRPEIVVYLSSRFIGDTFRAIQEHLQEEAEGKARRSRNAGRPSSNRSRRGSFDQ